MSSEVIRASHAQYVPHVGRPHSAPVHSATNVMIAPVGASACAIIAESRVLNDSASTLQKPITRYTNIDIHAEGTWMKMIRYASPCWKSVGAMPKPIHRPATVHSSAAAANHGAMAPASG